MGKFVQNESMDKLITIITYFDMNTDLSIEIIGDQFEKHIEFTGKIKDFTVLKIESGAIIFPEIFDIIKMIPGKNAIKIVIYAKRDIPTYSLSHFRQIME